MQSALVVPTDMDRTLRGDDDILARPPPFALSADALHDIELVRLVGGEVDTDLVRELSPSDPVEILRPPQIVGIINFLAPDLVPELVHELVPELAPELVPELVHELVHELVPELAPELVPELVPELAPELVPELAPDLVPDLFLELAPDLVLELAPELALELAPELVPELAPELVHELVPELVHELVPDLAIELTPELVPDLVLELAPRRHLENLQRQHAGGWAVEDKQLRRRLADDGVHIGQSHLKRIAIDAAALAGDIQVALAKQRKFGFLLRHKFLNLLHNFLPNSCSRVWAVRRRAPHYTTSSAITRPYRMPASTL